MAMPNMKQMIPEIVDAWPDDAPLCRTWAAPCRRRMERAGTSRGAWRSPHPVCGSNGICSPRLACMRASATRSGRPDPAPQPLTAGRAPARVDTARWHELCVCRSVCAITARSPPMQTPDTAPRPATGLPEPLRPGAAGGALVHSLPGRDPIGAQKSACDAISRILAADEVSTGQLDALLSLEAGGQRICNQLLNRYVDGDAQVRAFDLRDWIAALRLSKKFCQGYERLLRHVQEGTDHIGSRTRISFSSGCFTTGRPNSCFASSGSRSGSPGNGKRSTRRTSTR